MARISIGLTVGPRAPAMTSSSMASPSSELTCDHMSSSGSAASGVAPPAWRSMSAPASFLRRARSRRAWRCCVLAACASIVALCADRATSFASAASRWSPVSSCVSCTLRLRQRSASRIARRQRSFSLASCFRPDSYSMYRSSNDARSTLRCRSASSSCVLRPRASASCFFKRWISATWCWRFCALISCSPAILAWACSRCLHLRSTASMLSFCRCSTVCRWSLPWSAIFASSLSARYASARNFFSLSPRRRLNSASSCAAWSRASSFARVRNSSLSTCSFSMVAWFSRTVSRSWRFSFSYALATSTSCFRRATSMSRNLVRWAKAASLLRASSCRMDSSSLNDASRRASSDSRWAMTWSFFISASLRCCTVVSRCVSCSVALANSLRVRSSSPTSSAMAARASAAPFFAPLILRVASKY
mmetsp:Transcript_3602/g.11272  ORF Transcript_3602/g.11272 Transcript_3602/m.11272 type:complete len:420 (-) Transcript_3602:29-1288(-)